MKGSMEDCAHIRKRYTFLTNPTSTQYLLLYYRSAESCSLKPNSRQQKTSNGCRLDISWMSVHTPTESRLDISSTTNCVLIELIIYMPQVLHHRHHLHLTAWASWASLQSRISEGMVPPPISRLRILWSVDRSRIAAASARSRWREMSSATLNVVTSHFPSAYLPTPVLDTTSDIFELSAKLATWVIPA